MLPAAAIGIDYQIIEVGSDCPNAFMRTDRDAIEQAAQDSDRMLVVTPDKPGAGALRELWPEGEVVVRAA